MTVLPFLTWLARLRPAPSVPQPSRDDKLRAARRSRRLAHEMASRQRTVPVRIAGAGVVLHSRFRSYPHV